MSEAKPTWTEEERQASRDYVDAVARRDFESAAQIVRKMKFPACHLMAGKKLFGADFIRERGYNTELADAEYGPDWLDRED